MQNTFLYYHNSWSGTPSVMKHQSEVALQARYRLELIVTAIADTEAEVNMTVFPEVQHKLNSYILDALERTCSSSLSGK